MSINIDLANNQENFEAPPLSDFINEKSPFNLFQKVDEENNSENEEIHLEMNIIKKLNKKLLIQLLKFLSKSCVIKAKNKKDYINFLNKCTLKKNLIDYENQIEEEKKDNMNRIEINDNEIKYEINSKKNFNKKILPKYSFSLLSYNNTNYQIYKNYYQQPIQPINHNMFNIPKPEKNDENNIHKDKNESLKIKFQQKNFIPNIPERYENKREEKNQGNNDNSLGLNIKLNTNFNLEVNEGKISVNKNKKKKKRKFVDFNI